MKCLFMGTPELAIPSLKALIDSSHDVLGVVAQPDRPGGRGMKTQTPPTILLAKEKKLPTFQPDNLKDPQLIQSWKDLELDVIVIVAYGKFLPQTIIDLTPNGCVNVHPSLLPKYRGAAPINWAILNNDKETGVTTMNLILKMDAGPILKQKKAPILPEDTTKTLGDRLAHMGAELLVETLDELEKGTLTPQPQKDEETTLAPMLKKEDGLIDWDKPAPLIIKHINGMTPWPGSFTFLDKASGDIDKARLKIYSAGAVGQEPHQNTGEILNLTPQGIEVACNQGVVILKEVQPEGKRRMSAQDYINGHALKKGMRFVK